MSAGLQFSEKEIRDKLRDLGYEDLPPAKLKEFARDLQQLIEHEQSRGNSSLASYTPPESCYSESCTDETTATSPEMFAGHAVPRSDRSHSRAFARERVPFEDRIAPTARHSHKPIYQNFDKENRAQVLDVPTRHGRVVVDSLSSYDYHMDTSDRPDSNVPTRHGRAILDSSSSYDHHTERSKRPGSGMMCKRKVLRRREGESRVFDESFAESESGSTATDISELEQRLRDLPIKGKGNFEMDGIDLESQEPHDYKPWINHAHYVLPSFIRPSTSHPHTRGIRKCDPVNRYHQFQYEWKTNKAPGEKSRKSLRWGMRGQMLQCETFERPQRNYKPNTYIVPTEKKRQALRWQVRSNMA